MGSRATGEPSRGSAAANTARSGTGPVRTGRVCHGIALFRWPVVAGGAVPHRGGEATGSRWLCREGAMTGPGTSQDGGGSRAEPGQAEPSQAKPAGSGSCYYGMARP